MKRKALFVLAIVMLMAFTGCGTSKEVSVISESVETETVTEDTSTEEVTDNIQEENTETEQQASGSDEVINESNLTEEKVQLEEEGQNEETGALEEIKETMEYDPDAPDPSLTQEQLDMLDSMFSGEGSFGGEEPTYGETFNDGKGMEYYGDDSVIDWD